MKCNHGPPAGRGKCCRRFLYPYVPFYVHPCMLPLPHSSLPSTIFDWRVDRRGKALSAFGEAGSTFDALPCRRSLSTAARGHLTHLALFDLTGSSSLQPARSLDTHHPSPLAVLPFVSGSPALRTARWFLVVVPGGGGATRAHLAPIPFVRCRVLPSSPLLVSETSNLTSLCALSSRPANTPLCSPTNRRHPPIPYTPPTALFTW